MKQFSKLQNTAQTALFFICCLFYVQTAFSQGEANNWYFGNKAGITFNGGSPPTALTDGAMITTEGCTAISDANGNLLFYTNGNTVFNRNHDTMPNGIGLLGSYSSAQSSIVVPKPGSHVHYYIITTSPAEVSGVQGIRYSQVDMTLDGGLGDIDTTQKNILMYAPSAEKLTAVKHANGLYYWVIGRHYGASKKYVSFRIDCNGVDLDSVVSDVGITNGETLGGIVASPDGSKLASASNVTGIEITDFNTSTGIVSNALLLGMINYYGYSAANYGVAFSPDGSKLYATNIYNWALVQWDLNSLPTIDSVLIGYTNGSATTRGTVPYRGGALQLAPDGKIYVAEQGKNSLGVINQPNLSGTACSFNTAQIGLSGKTCRLGLPNFASYHFNSAPMINYMVDCDNLSVTFSINGSSFLDSVKWNFGDPASGANNISSLGSPSHIFSSSGIYNVQLIRYLNCITDTAIETVNIDASHQNPSIVGITHGYHCGTDSTELTANPGGMNYAWSVPAGFPNPGNVRTITGAIPGLYRVTVTNANGCSDVAMTNVNSLPDSVSNVSWPWQTNKIDPHALAYSAPYILADSDTNVYILGLAQCNMYLDSQGYMAFPHFGQKALNDGNCSKVFVIKLGQNPWITFIDIIDAYRYNNMTFDSVGNLVICTDARPGQRSLIAQFDKCSGAMLNYVEPTTK